VTSLSLQFLFYLICNQITKIQKGDDLKELFEITSTDKNLFIFLGVLAGAIALYFILQAVALKVVSKLVKKTVTKFDDILFNKKFVRRVILLIPTVIVNRYTWLLGENAADVKTGLYVWYTLLSILIVFSAIDAFIELYERHEGLNRKSLKGYLQIIKIVLGFWALVVIAGIFTDQSPWSIITGLSALTAILMLVFRDTILSFIVNIQINSYDLVEKGDWIEVPAFSADGTVTDISLHTIKVQNGDNTISIIPTYKLMEVGYKNWRRIQELNARRIKRSVIIDSSSIKSLDEVLITKLKAKPALKNFVEEFLESDDYKNSIEVDVTNLMLFRHYIRWFLLRQEKIRSDLNISARLLQPVYSGFPLEIYAFTSETTFAKYEDLQAQLMEHLVAISHYFEILIFQKSVSGV
jgi:miniconductance mechanosensitive channel